MMIVLILLAGAAVLELCMYAKPAWHYRRALASVAVVIGAFASGGLVVWWFSLFTALFLLVGMYRLFNMIRVAENRIQEKHLYQVTRRTSLVLLAVQVGVLGAWLGWSQWHDTTQTVWSVLAVVQVAVAAGLLLSVRRNLARMQWPIREQNYTDKELSTVTVAIPARNETEDLQHCLKSLIASNYPKLEIIVLDDCSQLKRTPEIIREFAQDGVRFIQGHGPEANWLPKNLAYARLADEASGSYILFCGVDVRFQPHTLREIVGLMLDRNKEMVSILPRREHDAYGHLSLLQAMRYWWELVPPRRLFRRPPVLSSAWMITRAALDRAGGFAAVARSIAPEAHFAREATKRDGYSFMRASAEAGLTSTKQVTEQRDTALRTRYPQLHRRPEQVLFSAMLETVCLLLPFVMIIGGFFVEIGVFAHVLSVAAAVLLTITYQLVVLSTHVNTWWFSLVGQPVMILTDLAILHYSMWKYEFSSVEWKGRNVCIPAMHVVPHLPKID